jgi:hypothetical protein
MSGETDGYLVTLCVLNISTYFQHTFGVRNLYGAGWVGSQ